MYDFAGAPDELYTREAYDKILTQLKGRIPDQIEGLTTLSTTLTYGSQEHLHYFPIETMCHEIIRLLQFTDSENVAQLASSCVFSVLEAHTRSTSSLINANALVVLSNHLLNVKWLETSQNCIKALNVISHYRSHDIGIQIGLDPLLKNIDFFMPMVQREAISAAERITEAVVNDNFAQHLGKLIKLSKSQDAKIQSTAIKTIDNIASRVSPDHVTADIITSLCSSSQYLKALINLSIHQQHIRSIIETNVNFQSFLNDAKNADSQKLVLKLILNLLPPTKVLNQFNIPKHQRPKESNDFAVTIQPVLLKLIMENPLSLKHILMCLASTIAVHPIVLTEELAVVLKGFGKSPDISPYVLAVLTFFVNSPLLAESQILDVLTNIALIGQQKYWFTRTLNQMKKKVSKILAKQPNLQNLNMPDIINLISNKNVSKFEFLSSGVKRCNELLQNGVTLSNEEACILSEYVSSLLSYVSLPTIPDYNTIENFINSNLEKLVLLPVTMPVTGETMMLKVSKFETVGCIESWYNYEYAQFTISKLLNLASQKPGIKSLILSENQKKITYSQLSVFYRIFDPDYPKYHLTDTSTSTKYNSLTSFFNLTKNDNAVGFGSSSQHKYTLEDGDCPSSTPSIELKTYDSLIDVLTLLEQLRKITTIQQNLTFSRRIHSLLANPYETLYQSSCALNTIYMYPHLFTFETRLLAFKLMAFEPRSALKSLMKEFNSSKVNLRNDLLKVTVNRDAIFNEGYDLFTYLCQNQLKFEVSFFNEEGIGLGPTHEFFTLFSHELCQTERKIFRSSREERGLAVDENGMFFSPFTKTKAAALLGKFLAKAIQMECLIDINFNPAIFKLIRGKPIDVSDVDPVFARSLERPEGFVGLTFVYPSIQFLPLKADGENIDVTLDNLNEYINLIKDFTCGKRMKPLAQAFIEGFDSVFPFKYLDLFDESEFNRIFAGDCPQITYEELIKNVEISHGYTSEDKEIQYLFEIIAEMTKEEQRKLIQFITGYAQLPIGGLAALDPKLTVSKKFVENNENPDNYLPSVMTCVNYFKVPPYSSKEIMADKIAKAISEGIKCFELT
ncbi:hypothetical protein TRFO_01942 [Tritrichomonas foetus]|uniref:HECT-type E3 ubiquitin transferase n=1 Tax=Tritrichomonas foetus TaxID=1144522 RepID=A0A1J4JI44_9EUKA|nr:hypothetical protein TRFO_01942 [Tritrichomonas foetus]|eukprot:OHS98856.1 hypothetical protein TRFO_01942 [Tritrichomonas foetus]